MNTNTNDKNLNYFYNAVACLHTPDECRSFFEAVCTTQELKTIAQRLMVAKMLIDKKVYSYITAETGASAATISRVKRSLECDGYNLVFDTRELSAAEGEP